MADKAPCSPGGVRCYYDGATFFTEVYVGVFNWCELEPQWERINLLAPDREMLWAHVDGAYVMYTATQHHFQYPSGRSRVFYIGAASRDAGRLREHARAVAAAQREVSGYGALTPEWHDRYHIGVEHGVYLQWYSRHGPQTAFQLEYTLLSAFATWFGSLPRANRCWPRYPFSR